MYTMTKPVLDWRWWLKLTLLDSVLIIGGIMLAFCIEAIFFAIFWTIGGHGVDYTISILLFLIIPTMSAGCMVGCMQWRWFIQPTTPRPWWFAISMIGWLFGGIVAMIFTLGRDDPLLDTGNILMGETLIICLLSILQAYFLRIPRVNALLWIIINSGATAIGWFLFQTIF